MRPLLEVVTGLGKGPASHEKQRRDKNEKQVEHGSSLAIGKNNLMIPGPEQPCQFAFARGPPTSLAADDNQGIRFERLQQGLPLIPAEIQMDRCFQRSLGPATH